MLVLSRYIGEKFLVGDDIEIVVLELKGKQVKVGVDAPDHIPIVRDELLERD